MKACSINRQAAGLVGINVSRMSMYAFSLSAALAAAAGLSGRIFRKLQHGTHPRHKRLYSCCGWGLGSTFWCRVGGFILGVTMSVMAGFPGSTEYIIRLW